MEHSDLKTYLLATIFIFFIQVMAKTQDTLNVMEDGCNVLLAPLNPSFDSSSYYLVNQDSLEIMNLSFQQMCFLPLVTQQWNNDTLEISIKDTAVAICLADCYQQIRFRIPFLVDTLNLKVGANYFQLIKSDLVPVNKVSSKDRLLKVYPNPVNHFCFLEFKNPESLTRALKKSFILDEDFKSD